MIVAGNEVFGSPMLWADGPHWSEEAWPSVCAAQEEALACTLEREMWPLAAALPWAAVAKLITLGVPKPFLAQMTGGGEIGRVRCTTEPLGYWQADRHARPHLALAVRDHWGALIDIAVFTADDPNRWALRRGQADMLGEDRYMMAVAGRIERLRLFATPLDWLRGAGDGICVLDWGRPVLAKLRGLGPEVTVDCDDAASADRLRDVLRWGGLPKVTGAAPVREAA